MAKLQNLRAYPARPILVCLALAHLLANQVPGQTAAKLHLQVVDSASGRPLLRTWGNQWRRERTGRPIWVRQSRAEMTSGIVELDGVSGSYAQVLCARSDGLYGGNDLGTLDSMQLEAAKGDTLILRVNGANCDRRELRSDYGTWTGHYRRGFEESGLRLCEDSVPEIWVEYAKGFRNQLQAPWPQASDRYYPEYFVAFRGTLVGPFSYGHFGVFPYQLTVDSILFVRR